MQLEPYLTQCARWPSLGKHILADYDETSIVVYQAFRPQIADEATQLGRFGPSFSRSRMSWIKPNFLWMMYRCGWAQKQDQERVLAVRIARPFFERLLAVAVPAMFDEERFGSLQAWQAEVRASQVRLQWDPDHDPVGRPLGRRALQLGLRGEVLAEYASDAIVSLEDITPLVVQQRSHAAGSFDQLLMPAERVFTPLDCQAAQVLG